LFLKKKSTIFITLPLVTLFFVFINLRIACLKNGVSNPYSNFANWAQKNIRPTTYIAQLNWDTFPFLFYSAPQFYYSTALDPMFTFSVYPEKAVKMHNFRTMKELYTQKELIEIYNSNLLFISKKDFHIALYLNKEGLLFLYQGKDGWLFKLQ